MVCVIVTKFNFFNPSPKWTDQMMRDKITEAIKLSYMEGTKETIKNVMFDRGDVDPPAT